MKVIKIENGSLKIIKGMEENERISSKRKTNVTPFNAFAYKTTKFQTLKVNMNFKNFLLY